MNAITSALGFNALLATGEPAGGAALDQVAIATGAALVLSSAIAWLGMGHRSGKVPHLGRAADLSERISGLPGWAALPSALAAASLLVALLGMYWDISLHIDAGRDAGPLANPAHYLILAGLFGVFSAGYLAICLPKERPGPAAVRIAGDWYAPVGGLLIAACGAFALVGFPLDDVWHRLFGQDVTLWGPTHLMLIGGAGMTLVGQAVLLVEGMRARDARRSAGEPPPAEPALVVRLRRVGLMGGLLIGLSTFQAEFDFGVPQFRLVLEPVLLAVAASVTLVCARLWIGRGGALAAAAFFIAIRGAISLIVGDVFGQTAPHLPLYLAEAGCVELAALALARRPLALGAASGLLIGTVGFAAEWGWSQIAMPFPWTPDLLPEALLGAIVAAIAGGLIGALLGCALRGSLPRTAVARTVPVVALLAIAGTLADGLWTTTTRKRPGPGDAPGPAARPQARGRRHGPHRSPSGRGRPRVAQRHRLAGWRLGGQPARRPGRRRLPHHRADPRPRRLEGVDPAPARPRGPWPPRLHARGPCHSRPQGAGEAILHPRVRQRPPASSARAEAGRARLADHRGAPRRARPRARLPGDPGLGPWPPRAADHPRAALPATA